MRVKLSSTAIHMRIGLRRSMLPAVMKMAGTAAGNPNTAINRITASRKLYNWEGNGPGAIASGLLLLERSVGLTNRRFARL